MPFSSANAIAVYMETARSFFMSDLVPTRNQSSAVELVCAQTTHFSRDLNVASFVRSKTNITVFAFRRARLLNEKSSFPAESQSYKRALIVSDTFVYLRMKSKPIVLVVCKENML